MKKTTRRDLIDPQFEQEVYGKFSRTAKHGYYKYEEDNHEFKSQYTLIYPSMNNPESDYRKYLDHANCLYE